MSLFDDRGHAGRELSKFLQNKAEIDVVVIPYAEALEIGLEIAREQGAEIEVMISDFISAQDIPYADVGAVVEDGTLWVEDKLVQELDVSRSYIEDAARLTGNDLEKNSIDLRTESKADKKVVIASEGLGSGFREAAVAGSLLKKGFGEIYVAAPFKSRNVMADIETVVNEMFYLKEVPFLSSPDSCYKQNAENQKIENYSAQVMR